MPLDLDVVNIVGSEVILGSRRSTVDAATKARVSIAAGLIRGLPGLVLPIVVARARQTRGDGGGEGVVVPNVSDGKTTLDGATTKLKDSRLGVASERAYSTEYAQNIVISQRPQAESVRPLNSTVRLIVSDGKPPAGDTVPITGGATGVTGGQLNAAKQELEQQLTKQLANTRHDIEATLEQRIQAASDGLSAQINALGEALRGPGWSST
jgi:hypothetical protein